jgi:ribosomal protein L11 methyltransferase
VIRLAVRVAGAHAELVLAELLELAPGGVEEVHGEPGTPEEGIVEYAVYGAPGELPALPDLHAAAGEALVEVRTTEIPDDWHERWREFHRPVLIAAPSHADGAHPPVGAVLVRPPWEAAGDVGREGAVHEIVIDPGQAFGTGAHATTRLCLELLLELAASEPARGALLDVGTGSGVLAIAAAGLGYAPVVALDNEHESVAAASANAAVNDAAIEVRHLDLRSQELPWPPSPAGGVPGSPQTPVVLANLLRPLLLELAATLPEAPAHLIAGGLLAGEVDEVADAFAGRLGLSVRERRERGEWAAMWLSAGVTPARR